MFRLSTTSVLLRGVAVVYFIAFASLLPQILGLIGSNGILPVGAYLQHIHGQLGIHSYWMLPSVAWISSSNTFLVLICWLGIAASIALFVGFVPFACLILLWILYRSEERRVGKECRSR